MSKPASKFRQSVLRTLNLDLNGDQRLANAAMGLAGEVGEVVDLIKKHLYQGHALDHEKLKNEAGDVRYYLELLLICLDTPMSEVKKGNMEKLAKRYPGGFSATASQKRVDSASPLYQVRDLGCSTCMGGLSPCTCLKR